MSIAGIDLGNSRTKIAVLDDQGHPTMQANGIGELFTHSVVYIDENGQAIVGSEALNASFLNPERAVLNWKRHMGTDEVLYTSESTTFCAKDIASIILGHVAKNYEERTGEILTEASITVPANYTDKQKQETIDAAKSVGIDAIITPHEPSAGAVGNNVHRRGNGRVLVVDLGGGTFDVSLVDVSGNNVSIITTNGDPRLGGQDFTNAIVDCVLDDFENQHGFRPDGKDHAVVIHELHTRAEQAKLTLSVRDTSSVQLVCDGRVVSTTITRTDFANRTRPLVDRALDCIERSLEEASLSSSQITQALPVGGGSQMPSFQEAINERFGLTLTSHAEPHFAVALGALQIARLTKEQAGEAVTVGGRKLPPLELSVQERTAHPIGVAVLDNQDSLVNSVILKKGVLMPSDHMSIYQLAKPGDTGAIIQVLQGPEGIPADACEPLGRMELQGLKPIHDRPHRIEIRIHIDKNGILTAEAYDPMSHVREEMTVEWKNDAA